MPKAQSDLIPDHPLLMKTSPKVCPACGKPRPTGVQYGRGRGTGPSMHPCHYDGCSEFECEGCGHRVGAWSGRTLVGDDHEPPYGEVHRTGCPFEGKHLGKTVAPKPLNN